MKLPPINSDVIVVTRNDTSWQLNKPPYEDRETVGKLVRSAEWDPEGSFRVFTGLQDHPNSVIDFASVVSLVDATGNKYDVSKYTKRPKEDLQTWQVPGSKGNQYTVTRKGDVYQCDCVGFQMRRTCRHVDGVREAHE